MSGTLKLFNAIAYRKDTKEWFVCKIDGRVKSVELEEFVKDPNYLKMYSAKPNPIIQTTRTSPIVVNKRVLLML